MSDEDDRPKSFEEALRAIADEVSRGLQNFKTDDLEDVARSYGVDADRAKRFFDNAGDWLRAQAENLGDTPFPAPRRRHSSAPVTTPALGRSLRGAGPDPLDMPTDDQGRALAALDSGRWTVEPGTSMLTSPRRRPRPARRARPRRSSCACATGSTPTATSRSPAAPRCKRWLDD